MPINNVRVKNYKNLALGGRGGRPQLFVKLVFEIANDRQTRTRAQTFKGGGPELQPPSGARGAATPIFGQFLARLCQITSTCPKQILIIMGALLVVSGLRNS